jgi:hypothetical protein
MPDLLDDEVGPSGDAARGGIGADPPDAAPVPAHSVRYARQSQDRSRRGTEP